ncbi:hypothetical protein NQ318_019476 [Aromia moschata]|uniref:Uncharacterized protein n=1 Tax=Aromia moschata TaxID=1265417 RepID=A0AAV8Y8R6_9CUCU|nr:hypothetical protein NQ318_019476 [Aromia moschata]
MRQIIAKYKRTRNYCVRIKQLYFKGKQKM